MCLALMFTPIWNPSGSFGNSGLSCVTTFAIKPLVSGIINPLRSAIGIKTSGGINPDFGCFHLAGLQPRITRRCPRSRSAGSKARSLLQNGLTQIVFKGGAFSLVSTDQNAHGQDSARISSIRLQPRCSSRVRLKGRRLPGQTKGNCEDAVSEPVHEAAFQPVTSPLRVNMLSPTTNPRSTLFDAFAMTSCKCASLTLTMMRPPAMGIWKTSTGMPFTSRLPGSSINSFQVASPDEQSIRHSRKGCTDDLPLLLDHDGAQMRF